MIKKIFFQRKFNWALKLGILAEIVGLTILFTASEADISPSSFGGLSFELIFLAAVFFAPIYEEIIFRGQHLSRKWLKIVSFVFIAIITATQFSEVVNLVLGMLLLLVIILGNTKYLSRDKFLTAYILLNSILFGLIHLGEGEFGLNTDTLITLSQIGGGLISNWICINFKFRYAIYAHAIWNFFALSVMFIFLQFPPKEQQITETEHGTLSYEQVPYYGDKSNTVKLNRRELNIEGRSIEELLEYLELTDKSKRADAFLVNAPFAKFNIKYTTKHDSIFYQDFFNALESEGLITKKDDPQK